MLARTLIVILLSALPLFAAEAPAHAKDNSDTKVISKYIEFIDQKNWSIILNLWVDVQRKSLADFLSQKHNEEQYKGLFTITKARLIAMKELPYEYGKGYVPTQFIETFSNPKLYYVAVDYKVHKEDSYHINGVNYFVIAVVTEKDSRKIALTPLVPVNSIIRDGYGFGTSDEKTFDERRLKFLNTASVPTTPVQAPEQFVHTYDTKDLIQCFITTWYPHIVRATNDYYTKNGIPRRNFDLWDAQLVEIKRLKDGEYSFDVTIKIRTYTGPHNTPYGTETMKFNVSPFGVRLVNYVHVEE